ncbi:MAG TPA: DUF4065 domain-containing protein [Candidatus Levilactobacillus faecigallinarum]|uniref:DUF4065 domain-containing protein n=1 Tax=Candidatus Levilactobacillus faecigallinarum TaxID=2838638 RepID=A0A9D1U531_9LACO|nr:DUF4065 domain-containing protein [Candidatus Levilactobacillus faecigallinarum]
MSMNELSQHILAVGSESKLAVTNLALQKVMYFSIRKYLKEHDPDEFIEEVYDTPFQTWQYGPVVPEIYFKFSVFGSMPIANLGKYKNQYAVFDDEIKKLLQENVFDLVGRSHQQSFWQKNRADGKNIDACYNLSNISDD